MHVHLFLVTEKVGQAGHAYTAPSHFHYAGGRLPWLLCLQHSQAQFRSLYQYRGVVSINDSQTCQADSYPISPCLQYMEGTAVTTVHQGKQPFQVTQQVLKRRFYLHYLIHYKVIPNADIMGGGGSLPSGEGANREGST